MVLYQFIHIRLEINEDGKEMIQPINPWDVWKKKDQTLQEFVERKRSFKRSFAILNEMERRNYLNTNKANFKLCITGPGGSGIHSFIHRYLNDVFYDQYDYSIDDIFYKTILFNERKVELEIWETGFRSSDYYLFLESKLKGARGYIVLLPIHADVDKYGVFERIIKSIVYMHDDESVPLLIGITQIDKLETNSSLNLDQVKQKVTDIMNMYSCLDFEIIETSSKSNINIRTVIEKALLKGYFFEGSKYCNRRLLLERVIKLDTKVFNSKKCLIS